MKNAFYEWIIDRKQLVSIPYRYCERNLKS